MEGLFPKENKVRIFTDGGSRGNPGPAAIGAVISYAGGKKEYGEKIGETTNNVAEYSAVIFALKKTKALFGKAKAKELDIDVLLDSELVVRQMTGVYKIEEERLKPLFVDIWNLKMDFKSVKFTHVPREKNKDADRMVNKALDS